MLIGGAPRVSLTALLGSRDKHKFKYQVKSTLGRLAKRGLVVFEQRGAKKYARITPAGQELLAREEQLAALRLQKGKRWDKRWRVIIFDIPERRRGVRDRLRAIMQTSGFYRLQDSVWVYPHDCEDFMALLKTDLKLGASVLYMVVEKIENDSKLLEHFNIK